MSDTEKKSKAPALDQAQALAADIPGALPRGGMLVDEPVEVAPPAPDAPAPTTSPMVADVPVDLPEIVPDVAPGDERPPADATKPDLVAWAIGRGVPSYEAWAMTVATLKKLEV